MKALISPIQDDFVVQVVADNEVFNVAEPLYWVDCDDSIVAYTYTYKDGVFVEHIFPAPSSEDNKQTAMQLLQQTDWVNQPDVRNTANSPHLLNGADFDAYRVAVRQYAVYPVEGNIDWPVMPEEQWSNAVVVEEPVVQEGV